MSRGYLLDLYDQYQRDPASVGDAERALFARGGPPRAWLAPAPAGPAPAAPTAPAPAGVDAAAAVRAARLFDAIRREGHRFAQLDPLADAAPAPADLSPAAFGLSEAVLGRIPAAAVDAEGLGATALDAYRRLLDRYARGTAGYEFAHLADGERRAWLEHAVEAGDPAAGGAGGPDRRALLASLLRVEAFETYLHTTYQGHKRFSIEGLDVLVPMLQALVRQCASDGAGAVVVGMNHRGRLNAMAHVFGKPYREMFAAFAGEDHPASDDPVLTAGDVKYHLGWHTTVPARGGSAMRVHLCNNPSHLEVVDPVAEGVARAIQDVRDVPGEARPDPSRALCVTVHGDAAFAGEGVVAETLNLGRLRGYDTGGVIHIVGDNQLGFTTDARDARSTPYASDVAKAYDLPVVHVNADDPEACLGAVALAYAYRQRFGDAFLIDVIGYRRWGHNEADEPSFTQPLMYERVRSHPRVAALYADRLVAQGVLDAATAQAARTEAEAAIRDGAAAPSAPAAAAPPPAPPALAAVGEGHLRDLQTALLTWPDGFAPNPRVARALSRRSQAFEEGQGIDWGQAEGLAFATLLEAGVPIRLTGQDAERGTFAQRHLVLHDASSGALHVPLQSLAGARAALSVYNSPLTEMATVGFEYGYSIEAEDALVLWEAQYGDFANMAQPIVDQFLAAGAAKWGERSGLVLLLPHGYEGQGPEHSSARLERYLQLCAEDNMTVCYPTSAAQYYHLLRLQASRQGGDRRPLVVMSPKSLLRHPLASSSPRDLAEGSFRAVLDEPVAGADARDVQRLVFASGKVAIEYLSAPDVGPGRPPAALVRVERLYPFPADELGAAIARYPAVREAIWLQEEPANMGAFTFVEPRLGPLLPLGVDLRYVGPAAAASPATGWPSLHASEMRRIVEAARGPAGDATRPLTQAKERSAHGR